MIRYDAIDKDGISRVYGFGETNYEASIQCEIALREYCLKHFKTGRTLFPKEYKIVKSMESYEYIQHKFPKDFKGGETYNDIFRKETDTEKRERVKETNANIERVDAQTKINS